MSILLFGAGAIAFLAGAIMMTFGVLLELSLGNSLIVAGTTALVGGVIVAGLGAAVSQLQRIADAMNRGAPLRAGRPLNAADGARSAPGRLPFPPRPKPDLKSEPAEPADFAPAASFSDSMSDQAAPTLPNPDEPPVTVDDEVSLSPRHPFAPAPPAEREESLPPPPFSLRGDEPAPLDEPREPPPAFDAGWRSPPKAAPKTPPVIPPVPPAKPITPPPPPPRQSTYFDSMWPAEPKLGEAKEPKETKPAEPKFESPFAPPPRAAAKAAEPDPEVQPEMADDAPEPAADRGGDAPMKDEPRSVAILKSGVVDGMGYTLYVDGSIEAELPQGTLHFASINELRSHLEKTS